MEKQKESNWYIAYCRALCCTIQTGDVQPLGYQHVNNGTGGRILKAARVGNLTVVQALYGYEIKSRKICRWTSGTWKQTSLAISNISEVERSPAPDAPSLLGRVLLPLLNILPRQQELDCVIFAGQLLVYCYAVYGGMAWPGSKQQ